MPPHPDQPGLEVNDSPGLEVVVPAYKSEDSKYRAAYQGPKHQGVDYSPIDYQTYQGAPDYPQQTYQGAANYQRAYCPGSASEQDIYQGSDKEAVPGQFQKQGKKILGLPILWFWIAISLIAVGAIAAGVGGSLAARNTKSSAEQATPSSPSPTSPPTEDNLNPLPTTTTTSSPPTSSSPKSTISTSPKPTTSTSSNTPTSNCPSQNNTPHTPLSPANLPIPIPNLLPSQSFTRLCNTNFPSGANYGNPALSDISKVRAATLDDCIRLCAEYNAMFNVSGATFDYDKGFCRSVAVVERENEFCYLKNGTGLNNTMGAPGDFASAVLIQDPSM